MVMLSWWLTRHMAWTPKAQSKTRDQRPVDYSFIVSTVRESVLMITINYAASEVKLLIEMTRFI